MRNELFFPFLFDAVSTLEDEIDRRYLWLRVWIRSSHNYHIHVFLVLYPKRLSAAFHSQSWTANAQQDSINETSYPPRSILIVNKLRTEPVIGAIDELLECAIVFLCYFSRLTGGA